MRPDNPERLFRHFRFEPFLNENKEWCCVMIQEWRNGPLPDDTINGDMRDTLTLAEFNQLKEAMFVADNSEL